MTTDQWLESQDAVGKAGGAGVREAMERSGRGTDWRAGCDQALAAPGPMLRHVALRWSSPKAKIDRSLVGLR